MEHVRAVPSADPRGTQLHAREIKLGRGVPVHLVAGVARWRFFEARKTRRQIEADADAGDFAQPHVAADQQNQKIPNLFIRDRGTALLKFRPSCLGGAEHFGGDLEAVEPLEDQPPATLDQPRAGQSRKFFRDAIAQIGDT